jgi:hypothetical protein
MEPIQLKACFRRHLSFEMSPLDGPLIFHDHRYLRKTEIECITKTERCKPIQLEGKYSNN